MYLVVSHWEAISGNDEARILSTSAGVAETLRRQPGVVFLERFTSEDGTAVAVVGYENEDIYHKLMNDPDSAFLKAVQDSGIENMARWVKSERGTTLPHE